MIKLFIGLLSLLPSFSYAFDHQHALWTTTLKNFQNQKGLINYKTLKEESSTDSEHSFNQYLTSIQSVAFKEYETWTTDQKKAFLINSYNALTVKLIIEHYPVTSIKKIGGFFGNPWKISFFHLLDKKITTLDEIEHTWLRPNFKDYRIHAAVNCASISCPSLKHEAYIANLLNTQLDEQMKIWLKDPSRNQINLKNNTFQVSKIFDWYKSDFHDWGPGVPNIILKYLSDKNVPSQRTPSSQMKVKYLEYKWDLNEAN
ncbi:MAG: DUF547 domain-containing protein [Bdellovibrionales bacterium]|nr:DUF547 domain-containing protein [Bdellovibrionales bacterium]